MSKIVVYHAFHGCDSGCCGHVIEAEGGHEWLFDFGHPHFPPGATQEQRAAEIRRYVEEVVSEHYPADHLDDIDWENCVIIDD